jgi:hypothetical protein
LLEAIFGHKCGGCGSCGGCANQCDSGCGCAVAPGCGCGVSGFIRESAHAGSDESVPIPPPVPDAST